MEIFNSVFYFIIVIGVLVFIHEFGHFIAARLCGIHTDIFSFGMGPRLFGWNKKHGFSFGGLKDWEGNGYCEYRLSLFPIGGYVKVAGMVDESMDTSFINTEPKETEFRSKNLLQKVFVLSAGVIMNMLLAIGIFTFIAQAYGKTIWNTTEIGSVDKSSLGGKIGFVAGDKINSINNKPITNWEELIDGLTLKDFGKSKTIKLTRNNQDTVINTEGKVLLKAMSGQMALGIFPKNSFVFVVSANKSKPAGKIGLTGGDTIISVNNEKITDFTRFTNILTQNKNKNIYLEWKRGNKYLKDSVAPDGNGKLGFSPDVVYSGPVLKQSYSIFESIVVGFQQTYRFSELFVSSVKQIIKGNISAKESLGGPILIAEAASRSAKMGLAAFLSFMALLSITLAIINILPFPALDGGHIVFAIIESIIRREIPIKIKMYIQNTGMIILLLLMAYIFYNDIMRMFIK